MPGSTTPYRWYCHAISSSLHSRAKETPLSDWIVLRLYSLSLSHTHTHSHLSSGATAFRFPSPWHHVCLIPSSPPLLNLSLTLNESTNLIGLIILQWLEETINPLLLGFQELLRSQRGVSIKYLSLCSLPLLIRELRRLVSYVRSARSASWLDMRCLQHAQLI